MANGKFVSYIRVSTARQGASGLGLDAQQEAVQRFLNGGSWELLGEFKEVETGKGADALAKLDRLSRSVHFVSGLMESKVRFVACDMPEANELTIHIMAAFAEHEAKRISQRTKDALAVAKARGAILGKSGAANLRPNLEARQQAANAFAARLQPMFDGMRLRQLTQRAMVAELNTVGVPAPKGGQWRIGQVQRVLARIAAAP